MTYAMSSGRDGVLARLERGRVQRVERRPLLVEHHRARARVGQHAADRRLGDQDLHPAVVHVEREALLRERRVERDVGTARLHDPEQADHHVEVAVGTQPHHRPALHPEAAQVSRQLVRTGIELRPREGAVHRLDRDLGAPGGGVPGDELIHPDVPLVRAQRRLVPRLELRALRGRDQVQLCDRRLRPARGVAAAGCGTHRPSARWWRRRTGPPRTRCRRPASSPTPSPTGTCPWVRRGRPG